MIINHNLPRLATFVSFGVWIVSFEAVGWAVNQNTGNTHAKLILLILASMADENGTCYPSHQYLADKCCMTRRSVINAVHRLTENNLVSVSKRTTGNLKASNTYTVLFNVKQVHRGSERDSHLHSETGSHKSITSFNLSKNIKKEPSYWQEIGVDREWCAFKKMRLQKKKPVNETAETRLVAKHKLLVAAGEDKKEIIERSTENCWSGFWPEKKESGNGKTYHAETRSERLGNQIKEIYGEPPCDIESLVG